MRLYFKSAISATFIAFSDCPLALVCLLEEMKSYANSKQLKNALVFCECHGMRKIVVANISLETTEIKNLGVYSTREPKPKAIATTQLNLPIKPNQLRSQTTSANAALGAFVFHIWKLLCFASFIFITLARLSHQLVPTEATYRSEFVILASCLMPGQNKLQQ